MGVGGLVASSFVGWVMFRQAVGQVQERLEAPIWTLPASVHSGPTELWEGLETSVEELTEILVQAGYEQKVQVDRPGTFLPFPMSVFTSLDWSATPIPRTNGRPSFS